jgi:hypothetical protein
MELEEEGELHEINNAKIEVTAIIPRNEFKTESLLFFIGIPSINVNNVDNQSVLDDVYAHFIDYIW